MIKDRDLSKIKMLVMDVDGTLTDGKIYVGDSGEVFKAFNVRDGYRLIHMDEYNIIPVIITGKKSEILSKRAIELRIEEVHQGIDDKLKVLDEVIERYQLTYENVAYIGDDVNDLDCMKVCYLKASPADAIDEVLGVVDYVCKTNGGNGAVREFIDLIVKAQSREKKKMKVNQY
ncbi:3-deoxy-D-manno-octulosonate 8-phosphate phosphatase (KDO 8-P phosphatase) [Neobacillus bataviensis]|uniref:3-deoxy-D-manno-octulosonate 8-phosphate phosphatase (KDO 8-P phosphatase) n=1 Tax=Neobacillus bataviensis TaxID=220685 RepID=A0A561D6D5_9BACI|nr:HAD-IIIA family hydrolase [Neobacillus bataviensis]TWD98902.1 3-deoxy-D-manno-octulosonate 8-phosphate phosphatase (KDO 8-P phosphatase) [Neobacillus bataviensis]